MAKKLSKGGKTVQKSMLQSAGHEMKVNPPKILAHTAKKFGKDKAAKQKVAIMFSKAGQSKKKK